MKKSLFDADRLVFTGMTCLVASILLGIILVFRTSYAPTPTTVVAPSIIPAPIATMPVPTQAVVVKPPLLAQGGIYQLDIELADNPQHHQANAFCIVSSAGRRYLVSHASLLTQNEWQQVMGINLKNHGDNKVVPVDVKPLYLGPFTEDHQPNLLTHPDLGLDLVVWTMPAAVKSPGLPLASQHAARGEDVWIVARENKNTNAQSHFHCRVLDCTDNELSIQRLDRFPLDQIIGSPVVDQQGEIIGNVLGGNDLTLIGASAQSLKKKLNNIE